jgi:DnaJ-class molecular chaperone
MRKDNNNRLRRKARACRACRGAGSFVIKGRVTPCTKCKGTGTARNK